MLTLHVLINLHSSNQFTVVYIRTQKAVKNLQIQFPHVWNCIVIIDLYCGYNWGCGTSNIECNVHCYKILLV